MDKFKKEPGEIVQLRAETKFAKEAGTLYCTNMRLVWVQSGKIEPSLHFHFSEIKTQFVSTSTSAKALLRLSVKDEKDSNATQDFLFEFSHMSNARQDLNKFKERIGQVVKPPPVSPNSPVAKSASAVAKPVAKPQVPVAPPKPATPKTFRNGTVTEEEVKQRVQLLSSNMELKQLFDSLVGAGIISENDFWESRKMMLKNDGMRPDRQHVGMPSIILSDVRPTSESINAVRYRLTPSIINQIFIQHPSVERAYKDNVPGKLSEQEFWKKYVHSKYFYRDRNIHNPPPTDDLFSRYDTNDDSEIKLLKKKLMDINPLVDLSSEGDEDNLSSGYGVLLDANLNPEKLKNALPLLRKFNRHSSLVLGSKDFINATDTVSAKDKDRYSTEQIEKILKSNKRVLQEHAVMTDLEDQVPLDFPKLKIQDQKRYFEGHSQNIQREEDKQIFIGFFQDEFTNWKCDFKNTTKTNNGVLDEIASISSSRNDKTQGEYQLNQNQFKQDLLSSFRKTNELLRHFWASSYTPGIGRPPTAFQKKKNREMGTHIDNMYSELENWKNTLTKDGKINQASLINSIMQSLHKAIEKRQEINDHEIIGTD
ncbi:general transcription factor IIH component [Heterostelium album PN500]|uniref:General transcription factor IIH component n=1 Tax=Heterostelium pallidum (strain ATCC 26659 / Pp 5 / PN500) TaxID=670386 RepID=D3BDH2_HETP5|nr:general transcription factor IIH component [Heterostelium album PN500]EFA80616.1 general transcription factor IIH component [Heterostelium album PN500]|eukprot:XP_020432736.1 general transcription factor IIH component [Heterostelium album PN500]